jgi:hypothetical protein
MRWSSIVLAALAAPRIAAACGSTDHSAGVSPGLTLAHAEDGKLSGVVVGGEVSVFELSEPGSCEGGQAAALDLWGPSPSWIGGYVDGVYDFANHATRVTIGPEIGESVFGIDGGLVVEHRGSDTSTGFAIRPVLAFGYGELFLRYEDVGGDSRVESGLLVKWPIIGRPRGWR